MALYRIPDIFMPGFILISELNPDQAESIANTLNSSEFGLQTENMVSLLSNDLSIDKNKMENLIKTIYSILNFSDDSEEKRKKRVEDLVKSIYDQTDKIEEKNFKSLSNYLELFIKIKGNPLKTVKAYQILKENEKNYISSKTVSDIRIVFEDDLNGSDKLKDAVIIHNLKLKFSDSESGEIKSLFLGLDGNDISELKKVLSRAEEKEKLIREDKGMECLTFLTLDKD